MAVNVPIKVSKEKYSRNELLAWVKDCLASPKLEKIEQLCTGAAYCKFMDMLFPNSLNIRKVKAEPNLEREYIHNFKLLQAAFANLSVDKDVPIDKLIKGRMQDNLEFLQWFRRFFDANCSDDLKDRKGDPKSSAAVGASTFRRAAPTSRCPTGIPEIKPDRPEAKPANSKVTAGRNILKRDRPETKPLNARVTAGRNTVKPGRTEAKPVNSRVMASRNMAKPDHPQAKSVNSRVTAGRNMAKPDRPQTKPVRTTVTAPTKDRQPNTSKITRMVTRKPIMNVGHQERAQAGGDSLKSSIATILMQDRDFFYSKLRDIEVICHNSGAIAEMPTVQHIFAVLYAGRKGFGPPKNSTSKKGNN